MGVVANWEKYKVISTAVVAAIFVIIVPPPTHTLARSIVDWRQLAIVVVAALSIWLVDGVKVSYRKRVGGMLVVLGVAFLITYHNYALPNLACRLEQGLVVKGTEYTDSAKKLLTNEPQRSCRDMLENFSSDPLLVWKESGIYQNELIVDVIYFAYIIPLAVGLLLLLTKGGSPTRKKVMPL